MVGVKVGTPSIGGGGGGGGVMSGIGNPMFLAEPGRSLAGVPKISLEAAGCSLVASISGRVEDVCSLGLFIAEATLFARA